jgi:Putative auto-transporter adhesin, head GIN domain
MAMTTIAPPGPADTKRPRRRGTLVGLGLGLAVGLALGATVALLTTRDDRADPGSGSGIAAVQTRTVPVFDAVELAGTNEMTVRVGQPQEVVVRADDNLLDAVATEVRAGVLVVSDRQDFSARTPMSVTVTVPALRSATLSGTGELTVTGVAARTFTARLPGTGTLRADGRADRLDATAAGTGSLMLTGLRATHATATVEGTGSVMLTVTGTLDATVSGTGSVLYAGHPERVTKTLTGAGSITGS